MLNSSKPLWILTILASVGLSLSFDAFAQTAAEKTFHLSLVGYGPIKIGMTIPQASQAFGIKLLPMGKGPLDPECAYVLPAGKMNAPFAIMVRYGHVVRIDLRQKALQTVSGLSIGMSESRLKMLYKPLLVEPSKYVQGGHTFIYRSKLPAYTQYSMRFETDGKTVTAIRSGLTEEVSWVEGCS